MQPYVLPFPLPSSPQALSPFPTGTELNPFARQEERAAPIGYDPSSIPTMEQWLLSWIANGKRNQVALSEAEKDVAAGVSPAERMAQEIAKQREAAVQEAMARISVMPEDEFEQLLLSIRSRQAPTPAPERPKLEMPNPLQIAVAVLGAAANPRFGAQILASPFVAQTALAQQEFERRRQEVELAERARREALAADLALLEREYARRGRREEIGLRAAELFDQAQQKQREWEYMTGQQEFQRSLDERNLALKQQQLELERQSAARENFRRIYERFLNATSEQEASLMVRLLEDLGREAGYPEILYDPAKLSYDRSRRHFQDTVITKIVPYADTIWQTVGMLDDKQLAAALDSVVNMILLAAQSPGITDKDIDYAIAAVRNKAPLYQSKTLAMYDLVSSLAMAQARLQFDYDKLKHMAAERRAEIGQRSAGLSSAYTKAINNELKAAYSDFDMIYNDAAKRAAQIEREIERLKAQNRQIETAGIYSRSEQREAVAQRNVLIAGLQSEWQIARDQMNAALAGKRMVESEQRKVATNPPTPPKTAPKTTAPAARTGTTSSGVRYTIER